MATRDTINGFGGFHFTNLPLQAQIDMAFRLSSNCDIPLWDHAFDSMVAVLIEQYSLIIDIHQSYQQRITEIDDELSKVENDTASTRALLIEKGNIIKCCVPAEWFLEWIKQNQLTVQES